jgi:hypothetical protein
VELAAGDVAAVTSAAQPIARSVPGPSTEPATSAAAQAAATPPTTSTPSHAIAAASANAMPSLRERAGARPAGAKSEEVAPSKPKRTLRDDMTADVARVTSAVIDPAFVPPVILPVGAPTVTAMNPTGVMETTVSLASAVEDGAGADAVRAAEVSGHKRVLSREAQGQIVVPELGRIEVRASLHEGSRVDVHVRADEDHAKHVIAAHAPELRAHVHVEVPNAAVHIEREPQDFSQQSAFSRDQRRDADTAGDARDDESSNRQDRPRRTPEGRVRFVL